MEDTVRILTDGLKKIAALKDMKQCRDPLEELAGEPGEDAEGFRPIHIRMRRGLEFASRMAQETLDEAERGHSPDEGAKEALRAILKIADGFKGHQHVGRCWICEIAAIASKALESP